MPQVQIIPPIGEQAKKLRVAAYARVSSDSEEQLNSFAIQMAYYAALIAEKEDWEFAGLYADEGVTGTSTAKREDFQRLLADCQAGKIDRILVKSISRFARNTADCIQTVRELHTLGVSVYFEKEDIDTGAMGSEMLLSILGSAAQEESLSISQNLKWSYRRRMRAGKFITCRAPLGYYLKGNTLEPDPQEVPIVHYIFRSYLAGKGTVEIAEELNHLDSSPRQRWSTSAILYILRNENISVIPWFKRNLPQILFLSGNSSTEDRSHNITFIILTQPYFPQRLLKLCKIFCVTSTKPMRRRSP